MRKVAQQLAVCLSQPNLTLFAVDLQLLFNLGDFEYQRNIRDELYRRDHTHRQRLTPDPAQFHDLFSLPKSVGLRIGDQLAHFDIVTEHASGKLTHKRFARRVKQQLG
jgi:hypothetical protein